MELPKRKNLRLQNYNYASNGAYFITICSYQRGHLFGNIPIDPVGQGLCSCHLSDTGKMIEYEILQMPFRYPSIRIDKYIIMPNHIHLIVNIERERQEQSPCPTIGDVICTLKSITTKKVNQKDKILGRKIWQFRYHDHIFRNEQEYQIIWEYIENNPLKWELDKYYTK